MDSRSPLASSLADAAAQIADSTNKMQAAQQHSTELAKQRTDIEQQMKPLLEQIKVLQEQLKPLEAKKKNIDEQLATDYGRIHRFNAKIKEMKQEHYYYTHVKEPKLTKPCHLEHLSTERLDEIYKQIYGRYPIVTVHLPGREVNWKHVSKSEPEYQKLLLERYPKCIPCDTVCHAQQDCPMRICSLCKEQGHDPQQCSQRICYQCKKPGHDQIKCPEFKCQLCNNVGHLALNCTEFYTKRVNRTPLNYGPN